MQYDLKFDTPFVLENGVRLPELIIRYHTYGTVAPDGGNVVWVCHALTANSDVADWWPHTVEAGRFLDPEKYFIVCANILGSPYGTTSPVSINPATGERWDNDFPDVTVRDMVAAHRLLADRLGIKQIFMMIGSSIGGYQAIEWAVQEPDRFRHLVFIATSPRTTPWAAAFNESQRMALTADATWGERSPDAAGNGLAAARSIALLSYRGPRAYDLTQEETDIDPAEAGTQRRVLSYQRYQGEKLRRRFNAYCYHRLTRALDSHNICRSRADMASLLGNVRTPTLVVGISSDLLFPLYTFEDWVPLLPNARFEVIDSDFGHDGFLIEHEKLNSIIQNFLNEHQD